MNSNRTVKTEGIKADIVIVGGGGAGLAAAVAAAEEGVKNIVVMEMRPATGGNSVLASGFFSTGSPGQSGGPVNPGNDEIFKKSMDYAHWRTNPRLVRTLIEKSGDAVAWLEKQGVTFIVDDTFSPVGGHRIPRISGPGRGGAHVMKALAKRCEELGIRLLLQTRAKRLATRGGRITGVLAEAKGGGEVKIAARSVIIATGGFAGNRQLLKKYVPNYQEEDEIHLGGLPHQGDGLLMAERAGAATDGHVLLELSMFIFPGSMHLSLIAKHPATLWLNKKGERFTDESTRFPEITNAIFRQPGKIVYVLFDEKTKQSIFSEGVNTMDANMIAPGSWPAETEKSLRTQADNGRVKIAGSRDEIAAWMGVDPEVFKAAVDEYNNACDTGRDEIFVKDKKYLLPLRTPPFYAMRCCANLLVTHGDIRINPRMEVIDRQDKPVPGLYAAGDDTGDVDAGAYNINLPGHSFGFAINSGRIAGENAARYVSK